MKAVMLKLDTYMDNGLMYYVYQNQGQKLITLGVTSLDRFYNLPLMNIDPKSSEVFLTSLEDRTLMF